MISDNPTMRRVTGLLGGFSERMRLTDVQPFQGAYFAGGMILRDLRSYRPPEVRVS